MRLALTIARLFAAFVGVAGFLFGQFFFGLFSLTGTITGIAGLIAGVFGSPQRDRRALIVPVCVAGIIGVALDAVHYYRELNVAGNDNGWELKGPFVLALALIGYASVKAGA